METERLFLSVKLRLETQAQLPKRAEFEGSALLRLKRRHKRLPRQIDTLPATLRNVTL